MRYVLGFAATAIALALGVRPSSAQPQETTAAEILDHANGWSIDQPVPEELLEFRDSGGCFRIDTDTVALYESVTNASLLLHIVLTTTVDDAVWALAVERGVYLAGPVRFFAEVLPGLAQHPELYQARRYRRLVKRAKLRHVVIDGISVSPQEFPPGEAASVLQHFRDDVQGGEPFAATYKRYAHDYEYLTPGELCPRTRIGNLGDLVIYKSHSSAEPFRSYELPSGHAKPLLRAAPGDILILSDPEGHAKNLYRVREVYAGGV